MACLAGQMMQRSHSLFLIERLQPDWLSSRRQLYLYRLVDGLVFGLVDGLVFGLVDGLVFGLLGSPRSAEVAIKKLPNQGIRQSLKNGLVFGLVVGLLGGLSAGLSAGLGVGLGVGLSVGLFVCIKHFVLRWLLFCTRCIPWNYARFLDYGVDRIFLRRVGGGYIFIHRLVMEHFAGLTDEEIKRITGGVQSA